MSASKPRTMISIIERILLAFWVGGMWTVAYLAVPILFGSLDDRRLAGELAGHMFSGIYIIGLIAGLVLLFGNIYLLGREWIRTWQNWALILMLVFVCVGHFGLQPLMQELKMQGELIEGSEQARQFGRLHGISSLLYLVTSLLGLSLLIFGLRRKGERT